jgi:hypothetical protein
MKSWRSGFIRCRSREEPWGSHHVDARALKCETSSGLTEDEDELWARNWFCTNRGAVRRRRLRLRRDVGWRGETITEPIGCFASRLGRLGNGDVKVAWCGGDSACRGVFVSQSSEYVSEELTQQIMFAFVSRRAGALLTGPCTKATRILKCKRPGSHCHPHARADPSRYSDSDILGNFILFPLCTSAPSDFSVLFPKHPTVSQTSHRSPRISDNLQIPEPRLFLKNRRKRGRFSLHHQSHTKKQPCLRPRSRSNLTR